MIFGPCQDTSYTAITLNQESNITRREESFPIPLQYIDVSRTTHTNLDVKQERRVDDYWNIDGSRDLSDPWTGFTQVTLLEENPPEGFMWSGERLTKRQKNGTSMDQENCLIIGQVSPSLLYEVRNVQKDTCGPV